MKETEKGTPNRSGDQESGAVQANGRPRFLYFRALKMFGKNSGYSAQDVR